MTGSRFWWWAPASPAWRRRARCTVGGDGRDRRAGTGGRRARHRNLPAGQRGAGAGRAGARRAGQRPRGADRPAAGRRPSGPVPVRLRRRRGVAGRRAEPGAAPRRPAPGPARRRQGRADPVGLLARVHHRHRRRRAGRLRRRQRGRYDLVVGADGVHSTMRRAAVRRVGAPPVRSGSTRGASSPRGRTPHPSGR